MCEVEETERSSHLGTKEHWEEAYSSELRNFEEDEDDVGDVWFGRQCLKRVVEALKRRWDDPMSRSEVSVLDLGTGNGVTLVELRKAGFKKLSGIDYVSSSIDLANAILVKEFGIDHGTHLCCMDFMNESDFTTLENVPFDVCFDKGTYDAIRLNPDCCAQKTPKIYAQNVKKMLKPAGILVLTSCNWTAAELVSHFIDELERIDTVTHPSMSFGGATGSTCTTVIFKVL